MKNFLLVLALGAIFVAIAPALPRRHTAVAAAAPTPAAGPMAPRYHSALGNFHGGLGGASLSLDTAGAQQVHTMKTLKQLSIEQCNGQVICLRLSRPTYSASPAGQGFYNVSFSDKDFDGGGCSVVFPAEGVESLDLLRTKTQPGLSFYVALDGYILRAVGREWRATSRTFTW